MQIPPNAEAACGAFRVAAAIVFTVLIAAATPAQGADPQQDAPARGLLDGKRFVGTFGPDGEAGGRSDTLSFADGHFWSANCVPCGFPPGIYWVRIVGDSIHFRGEMGSSERGRFRYSGIVRDQKLVATVNWRRQRWYWTVDRDFRFEGTLSDTPVEASADAMRLQAVAAGGEPKPAEVCPL